VPTVARTLGKIGADAEAAIPNLEALLLENKLFSMNAADALAGIGAPAVKVLTTAAAATTSRCGPWRSAHCARSALRPFPHLSICSAPNTSMSGATWPPWLGGMQVNDKSVVIALGFATKDKDFEVRHYALQSLQQMGTAAKLAEPYVVPSSPISTRRSASTLFTPCARSASIRSLA